MQKGGRSNPGGFLIEARRLDKSSAPSRVLSFEEITLKPTSESGQKQASRCTDCGVPFCQNACPLQNNIPDWLALSADGDLREAWKTASATSTMPEICGRICPQDRLCEGACTLQQSGWEGVTIGSVEAWIADKAFENGWVEPIRPLAERGQSVAIVGAGPAGLAAADRLRSAGYAVTVYDRHDRAGGLLMYGIPGFKLEKHIVQRRIDRLVEGGVQFVLNTSVGSDISMDELRGKHDAVLLAMGVYQARRLSIPGCGPDDALPALDYLIAQNKRDLGDAVQAGTAKDKSVVVVGGGDTAMDCVRTAIRQGATRVTCLYRRDRANMPGSAREVQNAEEEGVIFEWLAAPKALMSKGEAVNAVRAQRMALSDAGAGGRREIVPVADSDFDVAADLVIEALGFEPENFAEQMDASLEMSRWNTVQVTRGGFKTSLEGVFAAGDAVRGASLVVWAVRDGQDAAAEIDRYLRARTEEAAA
ncbi:NAD(P)-dependent oxidoreductase [Brevundimonas sp.]|uniref:NAD(P)-dependent oxidoreductase n=1 Tax=Brevundimonas sp. TaxID=1871086 RepID=UPI00289D345D|nr:NAD(P)-dependent oxidoreductase [Brevundimonas sp.]